MVICLFPKGILEEFWWYLVPWRRKQMTAKFSMNIGILVKFCDNLLLYQRKWMLMLKEFWWPLVGWYQNRWLWNSSRIPTGNPVGKGVDFAFSNLALHFADFISLFFLLQFNVIFEQLLPLKTFEDLKRKLKNCNQLDWCKKETLFPFKWHFCPYGKANI